MKRDTFSGLMSLYDGNYGAFMRLMPDLHKLPTVCCSRLCDSPDLYVEVIERCKFTTILKLTYFFELQSPEDDSSEFIPDPDLTIRIYHDANVVEAVSCREEGFMPITTSDLNDVQQLECRWESNLFLQKWLQYALELGHRFSLSSIDELDELPLCTVSS